MSLKLKRLIVNQPCNTTPIAIREIKAQKKSSKRHPKLMRFCAILKSENSMTGMVTKGFAGQGFPGFPGLKISSPASVTYSKIFSGLVAGNAGQQDLEGAQTSGMI